MKKEELKKFISNVSKSNITEKMLELPSHFYDMSIQIELLENELLVKENKLDVLVSKTYRNIGITYKNVKSVTPTMINHQVNCNEDIIASRVETAELKKKIGILKVKLKTLNLFSEVLTNVGHNYRNERQTIKKGV